MGCNEQVWMKQLVPFFEADADPVLNTSGLL